LDLGVPSHSQVTNTDDTESSETEEVVDNLLPNGNNRDSEWEPRSMYLKRKLLSDNRQDDIAYQLRSRLVRSGRETEVDKQGAEESSSVGDTLLLTETSPNESGTTACHTYNLRNRVGPTSGTK
jgi:hypothetical protein